MTPEQLDEIERLVKRTADRPGSDYALAGAMVRHGPALIARLRVLEAFYAAAEASRANYLELSDRYWTIGPDERKAKWKRLNELTSQYQAALAACRETEVPS